MMAFFMKHRRNENSCSRFSFLGFCIVAIAFCSLSNAFQQQTIESQVKRFASLKATSSNNRQGTDFSSSSVFLFQDHDDPLRNRITTTSTTTNTNTWNEYDRDAEFYKRRNQEYFNQQQQNQAESSSTYYSAATSSRMMDDSNNSVNKDLLSQQQQQSDINIKDTINVVLKSSRSSFKNVESLTNTLLNQQPVAAIGVFILAGIFAAYLLGFFILDGYIDNWNPALNDQIPYWDEPEIHTIMRKH